MNYTCEITPEKLIFKIPEGEGTSFSATSIKVFEDDYQINTIDASKNERHNIIGSIGGKDAYRYTCRLINELIEDADESIPANLLLEAFSRIAALAPKPERYRRIRCPQCGKELVNLSIQGESEFWCDDCGLDIVLNRTESQLAILNDDDVMVEWVNNGIGLNGDYDESDASDINLLDLKVYIAEKNEGSVIYWDNVWAYTTQFSANEPTEHLIEELYRLLQGYREILRDPKDEALQLMDWETTNIKYTDQD